MNMLAAKPYLQRVTLNRDATTKETHYPFSIPAIKTLETLDFHADLTFIIGENGSGKSTLLEAIAALLGFSPEGGTVNMRLNSAQDRSNLHHFLEARRSFSRPKDSYFLRAESFYNVATFDAQVNPQNGNPHEQSHGEAFLRTLCKKLRGQGLYLLDEPEAALSPQRQLAALYRIHELIQQDSQFIIATHSPILMAYPGAKILQLDEQGIKQVNYTDTEHYRFTKNFLNDHEGMMHQLLKNQ